jgi:hypothetical protein
MGGSVRADDSDAAEEEEEAAAALDMAERRGRKGMEELHAKATRANNQLALEEGISRALSAAPPRLQSKGVRRGKIPHRRPLSSPEEGARIRQTGRAENSAHVHSSLFFSRLPLRPQRALN